MSPPRARHGLALTELRPSSFPAFRDGILAAEARGVAHALRGYPGHPQIALPRPRRRALASFDAIVLSRRCARALAAAQPDAKTLGRILYLGHGVTGPDGRGPAPSAGNLQAVELYLITLAPGWLPAGAYHYDRNGHHLSRVTEGGRREDLAPHVPSLSQVEGGGLLLVLAGDLGRAEAKYRERAGRFLLLEAGHVMQSLCLAAASVKHGVVPIGGYFEAALAERLVLPETDVVLYAAVLGAPR